jgi:hypothetical protein
MRETLDSEQVMGAADTLFGLMMLANHDETGRYSAQQVGTLYGDCWYALKSLLSIFHQDSTVGANIAELMVETNEDCRTCTLRVLDEARRLAQEG